MKLDREGRMKSQLTVLAHGRSESRVEGLVVEVEVSAGLDHVAHDAAQSQAGARLLLLALGGQFSVPRLDALLLHGKRSVNLQSRNENCFSNL